MVRSGASGSSTDSSHHTPGPSGRRVILRGMTSHDCHDCGQALAEGSEIWLSPETGHPDESSGEPYCPDCASPIGIAA